MRDWTEELFAPGERRGFFLEPDERTTVEQVRFEGTMRDALDNEHRIAESLDIAPTGKTAREERTWSDTSPIEEIANSLDRIARKLDFM